MIKTVNMKVYTPIRTMKTPVSIGTYNNIKMESSDIYKYICARAIIDEVLPDGSTIRLGFSNYNKDNTPEYLKSSNKAIKIEPTAVEVVPIPVATEAPIIEPIPNAKAEDVVVVELDASTEETATDVVTEEPVKEEQAEDTVEVTEPASEQTTVETKPKQHTNATKRPNKKR